MNRVMNIQSQRRILNLKEQFLILKRQTAQRI